MPKLCLVYNADAGRWNAMLDAAHKLLRPETYSCDLCRLTHGVWSERAAWREFRASFAGELEFLHRDQCEHRFGRTYDCPVVLAVGEGEPRVLLTREGIAALPDLDALIARIRAIA